MSEVDLEIIKRTHARASAVPPDVTDLTMLAWIDVPAMVREIEALRARVAELEATHRAEA